VPFPFSLSGAIAAQDVTAEQAVDRLERALARASAASVRRTHRTIEFRGSPWFISGWRNVLVPVTRGVLEVSGGADGVRVRYRVTFTGMLVFVTAGVACLALGLSRAPHIGAWSKLGMLSFVWLWLTTMNIVRTRWRLPRFLSGSLSHAHR
jgi:hypothetical protein